MLSLTDLKPGATFEVDGALLQVMESEHSKLGRGGAIMRTKLKNLLTGAIFDKTFKGSESFEEAEVNKNKAQFLYNDEMSYHFMLNGTFEQVSLSAVQVGESKKFLKEGQESEILSYQDKPIGVAIPIKIDFKVTYSEPGFKGNTASATTKPVTIETGAQVRVPLFIKTGDVIRVDTRSGVYVERM